MKTYKITSPISYEYIKAPNMTAALKEAEDWMDSHEWATISRKRGDWEAHKWNIPYTISELSKTGEVLRSKQKIYKFEQDLPYCPVEAPEHIKTDKNGYLWEQPDFLVRSYQEPPNSGLDNTRTTRSYICALCGRYIDVITLGPQRKPDQPVEVRILHEADETSLAWLRQRWQNTNGNIPNWLSEYLDN